MIRNKDRRYWFGASDTAYIMGNWNTKTFARWWLEKQGAIKGGISSVAMNAGTMYEHRILDACGIKKRDRQIRRPLLRLRVNLDGEDSGTIYEVKTHKGERKLKKAYWQQVQVQMFVTRKKAVVVFYQLTDAEYENFFCDIDLSRIFMLEVKYDGDWVKQEYLPRLRYMAWCLRRGKTPNMEEFLKYAA